MMAHIIYIITKNPPLRGMMRLLNRDDLGGFDLFFVKRDGENAVAEFGFDGVFVLADLDRQGDSPGELTPITFLNVPTSGLIIFPAGENTGDG